MITIVKDSYDGTSRKLCDYPDGFNNKNTLIIGAWYYRNAGDAYEFRNNGFVYLQPDGIYVNITETMYSPELFAIAMVKI